MDEAVQQIQKELKEDLLQMQAEEDLQREELKQQFELQKRDKLADFQEKLRVA